MCPAFNGNVKTIYKEMSRTGNLLFGLVTKQWEEETQLELELERDGKKKYSGLETGI